MNKEVSTDLLEKQMYKKVAQDAAFVDQIVQFWGADLLNTVLTKTDSKVIVEVIEEE